MGLVIIGRNFCLIKKPLTDSVNKKKKDDPLSGVMDLMKKIV